MAILGRRQCFKPIINRLLAYAPAVVPPIAQITGVRGVGRVRHFTATVNRQMEQPAPPVPQRGSITALNVSVQAAYTRRARYGWIWKASQPVILYPIGRLVTPCTTEADRQAAVTRLAQRRICRIILKKNPVVYPIGPAPIGRIIQIRAGDLARKQRMHAPIAIIHGMIRVVVFRAPSINKTLLHRVVSDDPRIRRFSEILSSMVNSLVGAGHLVQTAPESWAIRGGGYQAPRPPAKTDDLAAGVVVGATWVDTSAKKAYICISNTINNAVWNGPL